MPEREDFALRAAHDWGERLPALSATEHELSALIRLSRIAGAQDRIDARVLRGFEAQGVRGSDDFRVMALLRRSSDGLTNSQLLEQLGGSKAGVSTRLDRLNRNGITNRIPSATDGRSHTNVLTSQGRELADQLVTEIVAARKLLFQQLTSDQVETLAETLATIVNTSESNP